MEKSVDEEAKEDLSGNGAENFATVSQADTAEVVASDDVKQRGSAKQLVKEFVNKYFIVAFSGMALGLF